MSSALLQAYQDALFVQDGCNLSGIVRIWSRHLETLWDEARVHLQGTDWVNTHPVNVLFASKVASLAGCEIPGRFRAAYYTVSQVVEQAAASK